MKIYTKRGDAGMTSLYGGRKVSKDEIKIDAYGTVDELNSFVGLVLSYDLPEGMGTYLTEVQKELFTLGAELATPKDQLYLANGKSRIGEMISENHINVMEEKIDSLEATLAPLTAFILPGGSPASSSCHAARTICRRSERIAVALNKSEEIRPVVLQYLNRLSDYLFVAARSIAKFNNKPETQWLPKA